MSQRPTSVDEYLSRLEPPYRAELERIRTLVTRLVPEVEQTMSYGMPTLTYKSRALVYFTASKRHMSFYPSSWAIEELRDSLRDYTTTEHAIRFTLEQPLSDELITRLVLTHVRHIDADRQ